LAAVEVAPLVAAAADNTAVVDSTLAVIDKVAEDMAA